MPNVTPLPVRTGTRDTGLADLSRWFTSGPDGLKPQDMARSPLPLMRELAAMAARIKAGPWTP
jgi:hypothetical protein